MAVMTKYEVADIIATIARVTARKKGLRYVSPLALDEARSWWITAHPLLVKLTPATRTIRAAIARQEQEQS